MKIYLAGPMRGIPEFNFPAFIAAAKVLRADGHEVFNPAERDMQAHGVGLVAGTSGDLKEIEKKGFSLREALGADLKFICAEADAIVLLPGYENSKGARAELATSEALGLEVIEYEDYVYAAKERIYFTSNI